MLTLGRILFEEQPKVAERILRTEIGNQRGFLEELGKKLGFENMEDWYDVTSRQIEENGGSSLLKKFDSSPSKLIMAVFLEHKWLEWNFHREWDIGKNSRKFGDWLEQQLSLKRMEDWYQITPHTIETMGGGKILDLHGGSPFKLAVAAYPEHLWMESDFLCVYDEKWERNFLERLGKQLRFQKMEDWYKLLQKNIRESGGGDLLRKYGSLSTAISSIYKEHQWTPWLFRNVDLDNAQRKQMVVWLDEKLKIRNEEDWYRVSFSQLKNLVSPHIIKQYPLETYFKKLILIIHGISPNYNLQATREPRRDF